MPTAINNLLANQMRIRETVDPEGVVPWLSVASHRKEQSIVGVSYPLIHPRRGAIGTLLVDSAASMVGKGTMWIKSHRIQDDILLGNNNCDMAVTLVALTLSEDAGMNLVPDPSGITERQRIVWERLADRGVATKMSDFVELSTTPNGSKVFDGHVYADPTATLTD